MDTNGEAYVAGDTTSTTFPVVAGFSSTNQGGQDGFITKVTAAGSSIRYSTYIGGTGADHIGAIALNAAGNVFLTGSTFSINFPMRNAVQAQNGGNEDAFVTELMPGGNGLVFSTYLGGSSGYAGLPEEGRAIAVDLAGNIYVAGTTSSADFPVTASTAIQGTPPGGNQDGFLTRYTSDGHTIAYSSYLGGGGLDFINGVAVDRFGYVTVVGQTSSFDFPTARAVQTQLMGNFDAFVTKFFCGSAACKLINSSFLGGSGSDAAVGLALNNTGEALLAGSTGSYDFPIVKPPSSTTSFQSLNQGVNNAFVAKIGNLFFPVAYSQTSKGPQILLDYAHDYLFDGQAFTGSSVQYGNPGDIVILGDWNNSGAVNVGVYRNGLWILDTNGNGIIDSADRQFNFGGLAGDIPVVGDWNGSGTLKAGFFRAGTWILDTSGLMEGKPTGQTILVANSYGSAGDIPIVGDWNGNGVSKIGIFRNGFWVLDMNGDFIMNDSDPFYVFGQAGDTPITGDWDGSGVSHPGIIRGNHWFLNYVWNNEEGLLGSAGTELAFSFGNYSEKLLMANQKAQVSRASVTASPAFDVTVSPSTLSLSLGTSSSLLVSVTSSMGYKGSVTPHVTGLLPPGVIASPCSPTTIAIAGSCTITLTATSSAAFGVTAPVTISASDGTSTHTSNAIVSVEPGVSIQTQTRPVITSVVVPAHGANQSLYTSQNVFNLTDASTYPDGTFGDWKHWVATANDLTPSQAQNITLRKTSATVLISDMSYTGAGITGPD